MKMICLPLYLCFISVNIMSASDRDIKHPSSHLPINLHYFLALAASGDVPPPTEGHVFTSGGLTP